MKKSPIKFFKELNFPYSDLEIKNHSIRLKIFGRFWIGQQEITIEFHERCQKHKFI